MSESFSSRQEYFKNYMLQNFPKTYNALLRAGESDTIYVVSMPNDGMRHSISNDFAVYVYELRDNWVAVAGYLPEGSTSLRSDEYNTCRL